MTAQPDGLFVVQSQLAIAIGRLHADAPRLSDVVVARRMAAIERRATEHGLVALATCARRGMYAAGSPGYRTALTCHLERMEDAAACRPLDEAGSTAMMGAIMAAIAVRLA